MMNENKANNFIKSEVNEKFLKIIPLIREEISEFPSNLLNLELPKLSIMQEPVLFWGQK